MVLSRGDHLVAMVLSRGPSCCHGVDKGSSCCHGIVKGPLVATRVMTSFSAVLFSFSDNALPVTGFEATPLCCVSWGGGAGLWRSCEGMVLHTVPPDAEPNVLSV